MVILNFNKKSKKLFLLPSRPKIAFWSKNKLNPCHKVSTKKLLSDKSPIF